MHFTFLVLLAAALGVTGFFFLATRFSILVSQRIGLGHERDRHVYLLYRNRLMIWLLDRQFISEAVLLFQYRRLVKRMLDAVCDLRREGKVLQVSCAFGDLTSRLAGRCRHPAEVYVFDLMHSEVLNASRKLSRAKAANTCAFFQGDAVSMPLPDSCFDYVLSFFLFHELPSAKKYQAFQECLRVLKPGGTMMYCEFGQPDTTLGRFWARFIFTVFEPYAREMWSWDPTLGLDNRQWTVRREKVMGSYFQVTFIQRHPAAELPA